jgi:uncharacterized membrane protein YuzA (DUF378 family)
MSLTTILAAAIVIVGSVALVLIGNVYHWDLASPGYGRWTRITGAIAVVGLAAVAAWSRIDEPLIAGFVLLAGVALAVGYVEIHQRLTERLRKATQGGDDA